MAISTDNGRLAVMELDLDWEPGLPLSPGSLGQDDQQQLLWGFPEILWEEEAVGGTVCATFGVSGRVTATFGTGERVSGTFGVEEC